MVALRTLLLQGAVALAGFGLSGAVAQTPKPSPPPAIAVTPTDPFGEQVTMTEKTIVYFEGSGQWDSAFETIVAAFNSVYAALEKPAANPAEAPWPINTPTAVTAFHFQPPVPAPPALPPPPTGTITPARPPPG